VARTIRLAPRCAADEMIQQIRRQADPKKAASSQRYF
jgi:hypothetical protein